MLPLQDTQAVDVQADARDHHAEAGRCTNAMRALCGLGAGGRHTSNIERDVFRQLSKLGLQLPVVHALYCKLLLS